jgi:hypothetical protein
LFEPVNGRAALLMVLLFLLGVPIAMLNEVNHVAILLLLHGAGHSGELQGAELRALLALFFDLHRYGLDVAAIFWGLWLFPLGYLVFKSDFLPRAIRVAGLMLMTIGCFGYLVQSFAEFLLPHLNLNVVLFTGWVEIFLPLWLLIKGVHVARWTRRACGSACLEPG